MEVLAKNLADKSGIICINYYFLHKFDAVTEGEKLAGQIQQFASAMIQGISEGEQTEESRGLQDYILHVLNDYMEAVRQRDLVLMIDTLDFGLRELLDIFITEENDGVDAKNE